MSTDKTSPKTSVSFTDQEALQFHQQGRPGKLEVTPTKPMATQRDLSLAYSPGVAVPVLAIADDPSRAYDYTTKGNLVAVISNGSAILGLGNLGALASKPVMEGKAVLFKRFADVDSIDLEVETQDVEEFINSVRYLGPSFGGINLEDIKAPECFMVEAKLREKMKIPVFHDDQHGTAIIVGAAVRNGLHLAGKKIEDAKIVASGAGAAALACLNMLVSLGAKRENIWITDIEGVVYEGREKLMDEWKSVFAQKTDLRTLEEVIGGADVFLGLSVGGVLKPQMVEKMGKGPLILALANPNPEIMPEEALAVRDDVVMCTGRSDYPNQVNNVICFPFIFRGALDVGATTINEHMKRAAVEAIAGLAQEEPSDVVARAYGGKTETFGPNYLIPSPFDQRLILRVAPAVAKAAMESGVATRPITDFDAYYDRLNRFVFRSGLIMKPIIQNASKEPQRIIYAEGEDERVLRAAQVLIEDHIAKPILVGRPDVLQQRCERFGLKIRPDIDFEYVNPQDDPRYRDYVDEYFECVGRKGLPPSAARTVVRTNATVISALAVRRGDADAVICGLEGRFIRHLRDIKQVIGVCETARDLSAMSLLINSQGALFMSDTFVTEDPTAEEISEMAILAAQEIRRFGIEPKIALLSMSNFGSRETASSRKMREALDIIWERHPELEADGEMHGDSALSETLREQVMPGSRLKGEANLLLFPNLDSANIAHNLLKVATQALHVGPILLGAAKTAHILTPSVTSRGVVNMSALASVEAQTRLAD
ncbi:NADP-dependent malic enzyme [Roseibium album]|uniref:NADP-dependent malic enzyme n=1 Tax=Roseibium album TaxID=311410 RepID=UPI00329A5293